MMTILRAVLFAFLYCELFYAVQVYLSGRHLMFVLRVQLSALDCFISMRIQRLAIVLFQMVMRKHIIKSLTGYDVLHCLTLINSN